MEFKGTKGKWEYSSGDNNSVDIILPNESTITVDRSGGYSGKHVMDREEMEANALLISKAPEMLDFLTGIFNAINKMDGIRNVNWLNKDSVEYEYLHSIIKEATELK